MSISQTDSFNDYEYLQLIDDSDFPHIYHSWLEGDNRYNYDYNDETYENIAEIYSNRIYYIENIEDARKFVQDSLEYMTYTELAQCYFNIPNKTLKHYKQQYRLSKNQSTIIPDQQAGAIPNDKLGPIIQPGLVNTYKFLLLADSIHDFKDISANSNNEDNISIPKNLKLFIDTHRDSFPIGFDENLVMFEEDCIKKLSTLETLIFTNGAIEINPFYKIDISSYDIYGVVDKHPGINYGKLLELNINSFTHKALTNKTFSVDIFSSKAKDHNARKLEDKQLYRLLGHINESLGFSGHDTMHFQVDNITEAFNKLLFSLSYINSVLKNDFTYNQEMRGFLIENQISADSVPLWIVNYSDSNIYDPAKFEFIQDRLRDERPTGCIYDARIVPFQFYLDGASRNIPPNHKQPGQIKPSTNLTIADLNNNSDTYIINSSIANDTFSTNNVKNIISNRLRNFILPKKEQDSLPEKLVNFNLDTIFALKRTGDWSQVEHAKTYGKVFITGDRYAALYAYFRGVPTMLHRKMLGTNLKRLNLADIDDFPDFGQFSFIIMNPNKE